MAARLPRVLGFWDAVGLAIGAMVGAGIFVLSGLGAGLAGPAVVVAFLLAGLVALLSGLSSAQLGAAMPKSGATYEYAHELVSPLAGFLAGWVFVTSKLLESATVALAFGAYLAFAYPGLPAGGVALALLAAFTLVNYLGARASARFVNLMVVIKIGALAALVLAGLGAVRLENFEPFLPQGAGGVLEAAALLFFAYTGFARIATMGEEIRSPRVTIPRATLVSLFIAGLLYVLGSGVAVGLVGSSALAGSEAPLALAAAALGSPWLVALVVFGGVVATASVVLGDLLAASRTLFAMGRRGQLPSLLGSVHPRFKSPHAAAVASGLLAALFGAWQGLAALASLTSLTILLYYALMNFCALRLAPRFRRYPRVLSWLGLLGCMGLALFLPPGSWAFALGLLAVGLAFNLLWPRGFRARAAR